MNLVTLEDTKNRLSVDFSTKDDEIQALINSAEGYLYLGSGLTADDFEGEEVNEKVKALAQEYVYLRVYLDYYMAHDEINDSRLTAIMKQLQYWAVIS